MRASISTVWDDAGRMTVMIVCPKQPYADDEQQQMLAKGAHAILPALLLTAGLDPRQWSVIDESHVNVVLDDYTEVIAKFTLENESMMAPPEMV